MSNETTKTGATAKPVVYVSHDEVEERTTIQLGKSADIFGARRALGDAGVKATPITLVTTWGEARTRAALEAEGFDVQSTPGAACSRCGGWTSSGGMSQHARSKVAVLGRKGCACAASTVRP